LHADEIVDIISDWEDEFFPMTDSIAATSSQGEIAMQELSKRLVNQAR
jgi:hypothetical protein